MISIHYFDHGNYQVSKTQKIPRWKPYKFVEKRLISNGSLKNAYVITLADAKRERERIEIGWDVFTVNFTPFSQQESQPTLRGSYFDTASWTVNSTNNKPRNVDVEYSEDRSSRGHHHRH